MKSFHEFVREDQRLVILRVLSDALDYRCNSSVIRALMEKFGHAISRDQVRSELAWLAEQGLVVVEDVGPVVVARLTERGGDVAAGRATVPGVNRPAP
jgi:repressor of nif and glnA expression